MRGYYKFKEIGIYEIKRYEKNPHTAMNTFMSDRRDYDPYYLICAGRGDDYLVFRLATKEQYKKYRRLKLNDKLKLILNAHKLIN